MMTAEMRTEMERVFSPYIAHCVYILRESYNQALGEEIPELVAREFAFLMVRIAADNNHDAEEATEEMGKMMQFMTRGGEA